MKIGITGASGLVGTATSQRLEQAGHDVTPLVRDKKREGIFWDPDSGDIDLDRLAELDGVIHLAGENIASGRWNDRKKRRIRDSRIIGTKLIAESLAGLDNKPSFLISASAIGYYGDRGREELTETSEPGKSYLAEVCQSWEASCAAAREAGIRVVNTRIGVVLSKKDGALKQMLLPFKMGVGGRIGHGKQFWSWISLTDLSRIFQFVAENDSISGPVNAVSPSPLTNAEFTKVLGKVLHRPTIFPVPAFAAKLLLGEMVDGLLMASAKVIPEKLAASEFSYEHESLESALQHELQ